MIKKFTTLVAVMALLFSWAAGAAAEYTYPTIVLDGRPLAITVPAIDEHGRTLVPVREFFTELGAVVAWDQDTQTVTVTEADKEIKLTIGKNTATINGQAVDLDSPPRIVDGRIMAPLRFVTEAIGASVAWNAETREISIQTAPTSSQGPSLPVVPGSSSEPDWKGVEPTNAAPTAPRPDDNKPLSIDLLNSQLILYLLVPLLLIGVLAGAILVRRSRTRTANQPIDGSDTVDSIAADLNDDNHHVAIGAEINHLTVTRDEENKFADQYLGATRETAAATDVIDHRGASDAEGPSGAASGGGSHDQVKTSQAGQPGATHAEEQSDLAAQSDETNAEEQSAQASQFDATQAAMESTTPADQPGATQAARDPSDADTQVPTRDDRETVEAYYQKGIQMLQAQNWAEARLALVYPSIVKYRDSEELGYYIEAQEQYQEAQNPAAADPYWAAVMADYYCRKIPDDYEGSFRKEIIALKTLCKNSLALHLQNLQM